MKRLLLIIAVLFSAFLAKAETGTHWSFDTDTQYNMTVTAEMFYDGVSMANAADIEYYEIGAFVGDECRGSYLPDSRPQAFGGGYVYSMMLYSNATLGETITFRLYNHQTEQEMDIICNTTVAFEDQTSIGSIIAPLAIQFYNDPTPRYIITVTANPTAGGTVTGGGRFREGDQRTVTATPDIAYNFVNWTKGGTVVSTNASYTFTVTEAADLVANFAIKTYAIAASAEPTTYGSVEGAGTYEYGSTVTLTASPNVGYIFFNWTKNGNVVSTDATYSFTALDGVAGEYVAHFATKIFTVTATVNIPAGGTVSGAGQIQEGQTCTLVATPNIAYNFINWTNLAGQEVSTNPTYSFVVLDDASFVANFEMKTFEIVTTASPAGYGQALGGNTYNYGATVNLAAIPNGDYIFANWTKNGEVVSTSAMYNFQAVDGVEGEYIANFTTVLYDITASVSPANSGTVEGTGAYSEGQSCTLVAKASLGYKFEKWTKNGVEVSTDAAYTFTVTGPAAYVAHFTTITPYWSFNTHTQYQATATFEVTLDGVSLRHTEEGQYYELGVFVGDDCRGAALPTEAPEFFGGGNIYGMTIYSEKQYGEHLVFQIYNHLIDDEVFVDCNTDLIFQANASYGNAMTPQIISLTTDSTPRHYITASANPTNGGTVTGAGRYKEGLQCTLTATPNIAYNFVSWTKNGEVVSTNANYTFTVTETAEYVANFAIKTFDIAVAAEPEEYGNVAGAGTYEYGSTVTLTGTPNVGYIFFKWTKNGVQVSTDAEYTFTALDGVNGEYVGHFATKVYDVTATANPATAGTIAGAGQIQEGQTCTLVATPSTGYNFVNWTKDGEVVSTDATYSFVVMDNTELVANFELKTYEITVTATPAAYGNVTGGGTYVYGTTCTLVATTNEDYIFGNWTLNGVMVSDQATYSFTVNDETAGEYVAHFARSLYQITATANPVAGGTVTGAGAFMEGQTCTLSATANLYYKFVNWTKDGEVVSTDDTFSFVIEDGVEGNYIANFEQITCHWTFNTYLQYDMTVTSVLLIDGVSMRTDENITFYELGAFVGDECRGSYLPASVPPFLGGGYVYNMKVFSNVQGGETITFRLYNHLTEEEIDLTCNNMLTFEANLNIGNALSPYEVNFVSIPSYDITVAANPVEGGTVAGGGTYQEGTEITLTATPDDIYNFVNWTLNNEVVSTDAAYTFTVMGEGEYVANFELKSYEITAVANPAAGGVIEGAGTYVYGTTCTLTATAGEAYNFVNWTLAGEEVSTNAEVTFTVTGEAAYTANFELKTYQVTVTCNPAAAGYVLGTGTYVHGTTCTLTAAANNDYAFVNWTENGVELSREDPYSFTVTEDHNIEANYLMYHWSYTFGQFPDVMAIFAVVNIEGVEQTSDMLEIAAFKGEEIRGREKAIYFDDFGHAYFFLMVTGEDGDVFDSYRLYDHVAETELDVYCFQEIEFIPDGDLGDLFEPYVFEFAHRQTFELGVGFNWFSSYIELDGIDGWAMLMSAAGPDVDRILSQTEFTTYYGSYGYDVWYPESSQMQTPLNNESMYRIVMNNMDEPYTMTLMGAIANPEDHPITLSKGMNHIGFISSEPITLGEALTNLTPTNGDVIKNQTSYAEYYDYPALGIKTWYGSLSESSLLMPGEGLMYKSVNNDQVTFTYPSASAKGTRMEVAEPVEYHWEANYKAYPSNMTVMAVVELDNEELASADYELAAFANGECRGSIQLKYVEPIDRYVAFLTVTGDETETLDLRLYNAETDEEYFNAEGKLIFNADDMIGSFENPFVVRFNNSGSGLTVYPNPVNNGERFSVVMASREPAQIEIINSLGVVVTSVRTATPELVLDVPTVPGVYTVRVITDGKNIECTKLIVK